MFRNYILSTIRTLGQNPLYTFLSILGIALTFIFVCILLLLVKHSKGDYIEPGYAGKTIMITWLSDEKNIYHPIRKSFCEMYLPKMKSTERVMVRTNEQNEQIEINGMLILPEVAAIDESYYEVCRFNFIKGRPINRQEIQEGVPVVVIDEYIRDSYFSKDQDPIGQIIKMSGKDYRIVGMVENTSVIAPYIFTSNIWVPLTAIKENYKHLITLTAKNEAGLEEVKAEFNRLLAEASAADGIQYKVPYWKTLKNSETLSRKTDSIIILIILMLIPALNILSLNVSKSYNRAEEIAVRKAFGATLPTIFTQLFLENLLITLTGAIAGICATPFILKIIDQSLLLDTLFPTSLALRFDWFTIFMIAGPCVLLFGFLSGSIPAWIMAKRDIVHILKEENQ